MKKATSAIVALLLATLLTGCGIVQKPTAQAVIATRDHESGQGFTPELLAYIKSTNFVSQVAEASGLQEANVKQVQFQPYRDTTLLEVTASATSTSNALLLVDTSITVVRKHFDYLGKKRRADAVRANTTKSEEQKRIEIAILDRIPEASIEVVERPHIMEK